MDVERFEALYDASLYEAVLGAATNLGSHLHGPEHWARVAENGTELAAATEGADRRLVALFALFHDAMRENDGHDPEHGLRAARLAEEVSDRVGLDEEQAALLDVALRLHADGRVGDDPTIGCCWDADRLDLPRVGTTPRAEFFSTEEGRRRAVVLAGG